MLNDQNLVFTESGATGNTGTRLVGDVIDLTDARDIGAGEQMFVNVLVATGITVGSSTGTYQVKLSSATDSAISSGVVDHVISAEVATSTTAVPAGTVLLNAAIPAAAYGRYLGIREVVATQNTNAGAITAFISRDQAAYTNYDGAR